MVEPYDQAKEQDIARIMYEQNCGRSTAEYVHKARTEMAAKKAALKAKHNQPKN